PPFYSRAGGTFAPPGRTASAAGEQMILTTNYLISLVSVSGYPVLGSIWEDPEGGGSCLGVTPSISLRPSGHTITRSNVIFTPNPRLDSSAASVVGSPLMAIALLATSK